jgi:flagellar hook-associated protein 1 FlgK
MAGILNIGTTALTSFQRSLATTGHNIANADTEGYSRQRTELATQVPQLLGAGWIGSGVQVVSIDRLYDNFLATQMRTAQSTATEHETYYDHASRIDNVLADPNIGLDPAMQQFFGAMHVLADDPTSVSSRQLLLSEAQSMVDRFHDLNRQFSNARDQLNQELESLRDEINSLADSLARVNQNIIEAKGASGGDEPNDLLDEREKLLNELAKKVDISVVPQDDGAWNVFIGKGQSLVIGGDAATLTTVMGTSDISQLDIAFTNFAGTKVITDQLSGGEIGGLLKFRKEILDPGQNQLGLVAIGISDRLNAQHQLGLDLDGQAGGLMFSSSSIGVVPNLSNTGAAAVSASYVDTGNLTTSDYELEATSTAHEFTLRRVSDGKITTFNTGGTYPYTTTEIDGFSLTISAAANDGDSFLIRPTREAAEFISLKINDVRQFAAAAPLRSQPAGNQVTGGVNEGSGVITQPVISDTTNLPLTAPSTITLEWDPDAGGAGVGGFLVTGGPGGILLYDPATESAGKTFTFPAYGGMSFSISGTPEDGDQFIIENNDEGVGDNRNALVMAGLQNENTLLGRAGGVVETATFQETYGQLVSGVGSKTHQAEVNFEATNGLVERHKNALLSVSGVNLDEEAANLVRFQQAYQAAAQVINVAKSLFDTLISSVRG